MQVNVGRVMLGGFVGTLVMTGTMYLVAPMMGLNMDIARMLGSMLGDSWWAGMTLHFVNGIVFFPLVYAVVLYEWLPGSPTIKGTAWGVVLWLLAETVVMPMMGAGFFTMAMGGPMAAMGSLVGHLLYGGVLGAIAGPVEMSRPLTA